MPRFSGGVYVDDQGYLRISAGPLRGKRVHEVVAEAMLGMPLPPGVDIHHKDENKLNPHWTNLEIKTHGEHSKETRKDAQLRRLLKRKEREMRAHYEDHCEEAAGEAKHGDISFP